MTKPLPNCGSREDARLEEIAALKRAGLGTWADELEEQYILRRQIIRDVQRERAKRRTAGRGAG